MRNKLLIALGAIIAAASLSACSTTGSKPAGGYIETDGHIAVGTTDSSVYASADCDFNTGGVNISGNLIQNIPVPLNSKTVSCDKTKKKLIIQWTNSSSKQ